MRNDCSALDILRPPVPRRSAVGAGDRQLAAMMLKRSDGPVGMRQRVCGVAAGTAAIMVEGSHLCRRQDIEGLNAWMIGGDTAEQSGWDHTPSVLNTASIPAPPSSPYISPRCLSPETIARPAAKPRAKGSVNNPSSNPVQRLSRDCNKSPPPAPREISLLIEKKDLFSSGTRSALPRCQRLKQVHRSRGR